MQFLFQSLDKDKETNIERGTNEQIAYIILPRLPKEKAFRNRSRAQFQVQFLKIISQIKLKISSSF